MDPEVEALYGLPLEEFTKARDALARARAKEGDKEGAAATKALRKPSVVAWGLNQLARRHPDGVDALLEAGDRLRRAQTAALEGGDPSELREATKDEVAEVQTLAGQARGFLADAGRGGSPTQEERLAATLRAAAVDPDAGDQLRRGVLTAELSPAGFGFGMADETLPSAPSSDSRKREGEDDRERARKEAAAERQRERERQAELRAANETAARLEREADQAEARAREARAAAEAAVRRAEELAQK